MDASDARRLDWWKAAARRPLVVDFVLALVLGAAVLKAALTDPTLGPTSWDVTIAVVAFLAALARRQHSMAALATVTVAAAGAAVQDVRNPGLIVALGVITYTIAAHTGRRMGWMCAFGASTVIYLSLVLLHRDIWWRPDVLGIFGWVFMAAAVGDAARSHRAYVAEVVERARRAEQTREDEARRRVTDERLRIARELHDVVAHHIAVISVQAGAATHLLERRPDQIAPVLEHIREASDSVLKEIQSVVGVLRSADEHDSTEPVPGLARLPDLLESLDTAGFPVRYRTGGDRRPLPAVVDLAAYRIVQEALTNAHKHGRGGAHLRIEHSPEGIVVEVVNEIRPGAGVAAPGYGLLGMGERAASAGGTLDTGATGDGRFRVRAVLPSAEVSAAAPLFPAALSCTRRPSLGRARQA